MTKCSVWSTMLRLKPAFDIVLGAQPKQFEHFHPYYRSPRGLLALPVSPGKEHLVYNSSRPTMAHIQHLKGRPLGPHQS